MTRRVISGPGRIQHPGGSQTSCRKDGCLRPPFAPAGKPKTCFLRKIVAWWWRWCWWCCGRLGRHASIWTYPHGSNLPPPPVPLSPSEPPDTTSSPCLQLSTQLNQPHVSTEPALLSVRWWAGVQRRVFSSDSPGSNLFLGGNRTRQMPGMTSGQRAMGIYRSAVCRLFQEKKSLKLWWKDFANIPEDSSGHGIGQWKAFPSLNRRVAFVSEGLVV